MRRSRRAAAVALFTAILAPWQGTPASESDAANRVTLVVAAKIEDLLPLMIDLLLPQLGDSLGTFPLPVFLGLELEAVDVDRSGEFMSLFLNFS